MGWGGGRGRIVLVAALLASSCAFAGASESESVDRSTAPVPAPGPVASAPSPPPADPIPRTGTTAPPPAGAPAFPPITRPTARVDCTVARCIALTFDDGPAASTRRLLDILATEDVAATFFMLGIQVAAHPAIAQAVADQGHEIGNHTWSHADLTTLSIGEARDEVQRGSEVIELVTGRAPTLLRAPWGASTPELRAALGWPQVEWSVDTEDWLTRDPAATIARAVEEVDRGSILLMHDTYDTSVDAVAPIIDLLRHTGYTLVTVSELFGAGRTEDGTIGHPASD